MFGEKHTLSLIIKQNYGFVYTRFSFEYIEEFTLYEKEIITKEDFIVRYKKLDREMKEKGGR